MTTSSWQDIPYIAQAGAGDPVTPALEEGEPERTISILQQFAGRVHAEALLRRQREAELAYIRQHRSYRLATRLRRSRLYRAARYLRTGNTRLVTVRAVGEANPHAQGAEVWLLSASPNAGHDPVPWEFLEPDGSWRLAAAPDGAYGCALVSSGGTVRIPVDADPELRFVSHAWSGKVEITFGWRRETIDLYAAEGGQRVVRPAQVELVTAAAPGAAATAGAATGGNGAPAGGASAKEAVAAQIARRGRAWAETFTAAGGRAAAVCCPRWRGVTASTRALFPHIYHLPATEEEDPYFFPEGALEAHARVLLEAGVEHVVFSGGDEAQLELAGILKRRRREVRCDLVWHGNYTQFGEAYHWRMLTRWIDAARSGTVHTIATVKKGMEDFLARAGVRSHFLLNYIDAEPMEPPVLADSPRHVGIWLSGSTPLKTPFPMLAAAGLIENARVHAAGVGAAARQVLDYFDIPVEFFSETPIPQDELARAMRRTHLSIYATFVECCPMLPLESLALGVPCLIGPSSHLFEDNEYLFSRLVVPFPDRAEVIAACAERAIAERGEIIAAYGDWARTYNERARRAVRELLEEDAAPMDAVVRPAVQTRVGSNGAAPVSV